MLSLINTESIKKILEGTRIFTTCKSMLILSHSIMHFFCVPVCVLLSLLQRNDLKLYASLPPCVPASIMHHAKQKFCFLSSMPSLLRVTLFWKQVHVSDLFHKRSPHSHVFFLK